MFVPSVAGSINNERLARRLGTKEGKVAEGVGREKARTLSNTESRSRLAADLAAQHALAQSLDTVDPKKEKKTC